MSSLDLLLLLMVVIWGANFSVIKIALRDFPEVSFNALRLLVASAVFLVAMARDRRARAGQAAAPPLTRADWTRLAFLGVVGHLLYQLCFLGGVARTSVANSSLIFGCTPVAVAIMTSVAGHERLTAARWMGAALSLAGIYAIVGHQASLSTATFAGDLLVFCGMLCWSTYSVAAQPLLRRHSALVVTGWSLTIGTALYMLMAVGSLVTTRWSAISLQSWILMAASALLALALSYMIWYTAVQKMGSARTSTYSNLTPIVAMTIAAIWLGEQIGLVQVFGSVLILGGIAITRFSTVTRH